MIRRSRALRFVALFAAYVVALQALLLPLSVAAGSTIASSRCAAAASAEPSPAPANQQTGCPCAAGCGMLCCTHALSAPPSIAVAVFSVRANAMTPAPVLRAVMPPGDFWRPQVPRAPPAAA